MLCFDLEGHFQIYDDIIVVSEKYIIIDIG